MMRCVVKENPMKLNEIFDPNYYDYVQDEMQRRQHDPFEDDPQTDTEMSMQDFIVSRFEAGDVSYEEARDKLKKITSSPMEFEFWMMELVSAQALLDD